MDVDGSVQRPNSLLSAMFYSLSRQTLHAIYASHTILFSSVYSLGAHVAPLTNECTGALPRVHETRYLRTAALWRLDVGVIARYTPLAR